MTVSGKAHAAPGLHSNFRKFAGIASLFVQIVIGNVDSTARRAFEVSAEPFIDFRHSDSAGSQFK